MSVTARRRAVPQNFLANCQVSDDVGDMVYVSGDLMGSYYTVTKVDYESRTKMPAIGMLVMKLTDVTCVVQVGGEVRSLYTGLTPGRHCFVGINGRLTQAVPSTPGSGVRYSQPIAYAIASNTVLLGLHLPTIRVAD